MSKTTSQRVYKFSETAAQSRRDAAVALLRRAGYAASRETELLMTDATLHEIYLAIGTSADIERELKNFSVVQIGDAKGIPADECGIRIKNPIEEAVAAAAAFGIDPATLRADLASTKLLESIPAGVDFLPSGAEVKEIFGMSVERVKGMNVCVMGVNSSRQRESVTEQRERIKDMIRHFAKGLEEDKADAELQALCAWVYNLRKGAEAK